jgi:riboflavin synthase
MFAGIVVAVGRISRVQPYQLGQDQSGLHVHIDAGGLDLSDVHIGDSIAVQGACMTVVGLASDHFEIDVSRASLNLTVGLDREGSEVNLEKALRMGDPIGGHLVSGHIDGLGVVLRCAEMGESRELVIRTPRQMARYLAYKVSIAVNGVSLTVNKIKDGVDSCDVSINLIPHTLTITTLRHVKPGDQVNLEIDLIARYVARMLSVANSNNDNQAIA